MSVPGSVILVTLVASLSLTLSVEVQEFAVGSQENCDGSSVGFSSGGALSGSVMLQAKSPGKVVQEQPRAGMSLMKTSRQSALTQTPATSSGICYFAECGCPPFRKSSCTEASREIETSWCGQSQSNCEACNAVWCNAQSAPTVMASEMVDAPAPEEVPAPSTPVMVSDMLDVPSPENNQTLPTPVLSTTSSGICYFAECGCPPFRKSSCTEASRESATSWCGQSQSNCETCNAVWCDAQSAPTVMASEMVDAPAPEEVPAPPTPVMVSEIVDAPAPEEVPAPPTPVLSATSNGICYFAECGCPPFRKSSCTEASREIETSWCGQSQSNCETCNAVWCDAQSAPTVMASEMLDAPAPEEVPAPPTPVLSTTSSGICYFAECGCPPFRKSSCTEASRESATSWCGQSQSNCETCNAVWC